MFNKRFGKYAIHNHNHDSWSPNNMKPKLKLRMYTLSYKRTKYHGHLFESETDIILDPPSPHKN